MCNVEDANRTHLLIAVGLVPTASTAPDTTTPPVSPDGLLIKELSPLCPEVIQEASSELL